MLRWLAFLDCCLVVSMAVGYVKGRERMYIDWHSSSLTCNVVFFNYSSRHKGTTQRRRYGARKVVAVSDGTSAYWCCPQAGHG